MPNVKIPVKDPASVGFTATDTYYSDNEPAFDAGAEVNDVDFDVVLTADTDLPYLAVVKAIKGGALTQAPFSAKDNNGILAHPVKGLSGQTVHVTIHVSGHFRTNALFYPASYDTDLKKTQAFELGGHPQLLASTAKYSGSQINIEN